MGSKGLLSLEAGEMGEWREKGESPSRKWPPVEGKGIYFILRHVTLFHFIYLFAKLVSQLSLFPEHFSGQVLARPQHEN